MHMQEALIIPAMKRSDIARTASAALLILGAAALPAQGATAAQR